MSTRDYILSIDQGTTGSTAILFDGQDQEVSRSYREIQQIYPEPGWVEQDPMEIFHSCLEVSRETIQQAEVDIAAVKGLGITNQRETTVVWDRFSGQPVYNAVVWQCRRTAPLCECLKQQGLEKMIQQKSGLPVDAYFSGTKIRWILDNIPDGQRRALQGDLLFGTVDSWLVWKFTKGKVHVTDYSNASRTMLFNINELRWDNELLAILNIPDIMLPQVMPSGIIYGETSAGLPVDTRLPIACIAGDQQASLFGQSCYKKGMAKNTYGTGSFVMMNTGNSPIFSNKGLVTTIAWGLGGNPTYAIEGSIFSTGSTIQWLRDSLGLIGNATESEALACSVTDNGGVYLVPAFVGLGAPHWDMYARGTIVGLTRGSNSGHIARAALEAIAYQSRDVIEVMRSATDLTIPVLRVDGGGSANNLLMQFQSDILGIPIQRAQLTETTALGAAYLVGLALGLWPGMAQIGQNWQSSATYEPKMSNDQRDSLYHDWKRAVQRAKGWAQRE